MAIEYTVKKLAEICGVSPQAIYKQKDTNTELRAVMTRDYKRKKNNSVVYGKETYDLLCKIYKDRVKDAVEEVAQVEETNVHPNQDKASGVEQREKVETTSATQNNEIIQLLKEQIDYLKTQLEEEKQARKEDKENYMKIVEEANTANGELRILLLNSKEQIKLLEEAKTPFFKRLKNKLVKKDD